MKINRFEKVLGDYVEIVPGQNRYGVSISNFEELFEIPDWIKNVGYYQGSIIRFYDFESRKIYTPFQKEKNIIYDCAKYRDDDFYFLRGDFNREKIEIIKYSPGVSLENIFEISICDVDLYNLSLYDGDVLYLCSSDEIFRCYYPENFELKLAPSQSVTFIENDKIYLDEWVEEGVLDDVITNDYKYYNKVLTIDRCGNILSEEIGCLSFFPNGEWWIS